MERQKLQKRNVSPNCTPSPLPLSHTLWERGNALSMMSRLFENPQLQGVGVGLRPCHYPYIETEHPPIPWFEILSDNYLRPGGASLMHLEKIRTHYPITLHGVGMSLGSTDPLNYDYLKKLKSLMQRTQPLLVSDHLCWTSLGNHYFHELLPLPYTDEAVNHVAKRIREIQDFLGQRIMIENVSTYLNFTHSTLTEWEFLQAVADEADALILLDINNIYVSAHNNHFNPEHYLQGLSSRRIAQFHLAGFEDKGTYFLDTHGATIHLPVWDLYKKALSLFGSIPTIIERDNHIPHFSELMNEVDIAKQMMEPYDTHSQRITEKIC